MRKKKSPASELGKMGGEATAKKYGPEHYRKLQKASVKAKKKLQRDKKMFNEKV